MTGFHSRRITRNVLEAAASVFQKQEARSPATPFVPSRTRVTIDHGCEGPAHDPYAWEEVTVYRNGYRATLRTGLASWLELEDFVTCRWYVETGGQNSIMFEEAVQLFTEKVGMSPHQAVEAYNRIHANDIEDPMGSLGDYI